MGEKIAKKIDEILETGQLQKLEKVSAANVIRKGLQELCQCLV